MIIDRNNILDVINKSNCKPDKDYGQNYLIEPLIAERIVNLAEINYGEAVLEIGPGVGSLTNFISEKTNNVTVVDIDRRMTDFIKVIYPNINVVCEDVRKFDVSSYSKIIANLPYNITTELIVYLLENIKNCSKLVLMCQSETFSHYNDISGSEYGPSSVLVHLLGKIKREFNVKAGCFMPAPKCVSTVFTISIENIYSQDIKNCYYFTKKMFLNRRKTILNNLINSGIEKEKACEVLNKCGIDQLLRPEQISPEKYMELYKTL